jgi:hypothetical protein
MSTLLYFGHNLEDSKPHKSDYNNPEFRVYSLDNCTLNITLTLHNGGEEVPAADINLYAVHFDARGNYVRDGLEGPETDKLALVAMAGRPIRQWLGHVIPKSEHKYAWQSDTIVHKLPKATASYLLVATVTAPGIEPMPDELLPSRNPSVAIWAGHTSAHDMDPRHGTHP